MSSLKGVLQGVWPFNPDTTRAVPGEKSLEGRPVDTRHGGPNMPRYHLCSRCNLASRRAKKTTGGAMYKCRRHGEFFVRAI